jgi:hypothetical protein
MFSRRLSPHALYKPVYALFALYTAWIGAGWLVWRTLTDGEVDKMEKWRGLIAVIVAGVGFWIWMPTRGVGARERRALIALVDAIALDHLAESSVLKLKPSRRFPAHSAASSCRHHLSPHSSAT